LDNKKLSSLTFELEEEDKLPGCLLAGIMKGGRFTFDLNIILKGGGREKINISCLS